MKAACKRLDLEFDPTYLDTLVMAQGLLPELSKHKLNIVADALELPAFTITGRGRRHDRGVYAGAVFCHAHGAGNHPDRPDQSGHAGAEGRKPLGSLQARHIILYAKNNTGLRNLYRLISYGHVKYYKRVPRIPKSELIQWREGLIIGSSLRGRRAVPGGGGGPGLG